MFQIGDLVKTHKVAGCVGFIGVITNIDDGNYPITVHWIKADKSEYPTAHFKPNQIRKVS